MGFFEFVFATLCLIFGFVLVLTRMRARQAHAGEREERRGSTSLLNLTARVEALEAIVTDQRTELAREIEALERPPRRSVS